MIATAQCPPATEQISDAAVAGSIEELRLILARQQHREVGHDEAREVAHSLIEFYRVLAEEASDDAAD